MKKEISEEASEIICWCKGTTRAEILSAIEAGAASLEDIQEQTGACTIGRCRELSPKHRCCAPDIIAILREKGKLPKSR